MLYSHKLLKNGLTVLSNTQLHFLLINPTCLVFSVAGKTSTFLAPNYYLLVLSTYKRPNVHPFYTPSGLASSHTLILALASDHQTIKS